MGEVTAPGGHAKHDSIEFVLEIMSTSEEWMLVRVAVYSDHAM